MWIVWSWECCFGWRDIQRLRKHFRCDGGYFWSIRCLAAATIQLVYLLDCGTISSIEPILGNGPTRFHFVPVERFFRCDKKMQRIPHRYCDVMLPWETEQTTTKTTKVIWRMSFRTSENGTLRKAVKVITDSFRMNTNDAMTFRYVWCGFPMTMCYIRKFHLMLLVFPYSNRHIFISQ